MSLLLTAVDSLYNNIGQGEMVVCHIMKREALFSCIRKPSRRNSSWPNLNSGLFPSPRGCGKTQLHSSNNKSSISVYEITLAVTARGFGWKCVCGLPAGRSEQRFWNRRSRMGWQIVAAWIRTEESWGTMLSSGEMQTRQSFHAIPWLPQCQHEGLPTPSAGCTWDLNMETT